jgi:tetratricopeptide (TPR) repeat protein
LKRLPAAPKRPASIGQALAAADQALRAGFPAEAERLARQGLAQARANAEAARLLGQALLAQGRAEDAIEPLKLAARRDPDAEGLMLLARALAEAGQAAAAEAALRQATDLRPAFAPAFLALGDQLDKAGRHDEAAEVFEAGLALAPDADVLRVGLGYASLHRNDRAAARAHFARVHAAAPQRFDATLGLAHVLMADGAYAQAADLYREALALRPDDTGIRIHLAKCQFELGQRGQGEATLRAATRGGARDVWAAVSALAATPHGRVFLRPSAAVRFLKGVSSGAEAPPVHAPLAADLA